MAENQPIESIKVEFCAQCRQKIDWAIDNFEPQDVYIKASFDEPNAPGTKIVVDLCESCGRFINQVLKLDGFTLYQK